MMTTTLAQIDRMNCRRNPASRRTISEKVFRAIITKAGGEPEGIEEAEGVPGHIGRSAIDTKAAGDKIVEFFDSNRDGKTNGRELDKCPGLKPAIDQVDPTGKRRDHRRQYQGDRTINYVLTRTCAR